MPKVRELVEWLNQQYAPEQPIAYALWNLDDVFEVAEQQDKTLTSTEAEDVLQLVHDRQEGDTGITWSFIEACLCEIKS